ncbi:MAG: CPBP family glutamic-type intramembrane protease [Promethearchaeota archaeon]|jgi:hypothetical protein
MRKIIIIEVEKSFLNFFTPAIICAAGYFLLVLFVNLFQFFELYIFNNSLFVNCQLSIFGYCNAFIYLIPIVTTFITFIVIKLIFIPRLKVDSAEYHKIRFQSLLITLVLLSVSISLRSLLREFFIIFGEIAIVPPRFIASYSVLNEPLVLILTLLYILIFSPLFGEYLYRRTLIPLLEDRGLSAFHAVLLSTLGYLLIFSFEFLGLPNTLNITFWILSTFLFGMMTGLTYVLTRNVFFPFVYSLLYLIYRLTFDIGYSLDIDLLLLVNRFFILISFIFTIALFFHFFFRSTSNHWITILKKPSVPNIQRGIIGFFLILIVLFGIQITVELVARQITNFAFPDYYVIISLFYLLSFTIPFWLSIQTEYAQD